MSFPQCHRARGLVRWLAGSLALLIAACGPVTQPPAPTAAPSPSPSATRPSAQLTGQLLLVGDCLRVQSDLVPEQSVLLVFPSGFTASVTGQSVLVADWLQKTQFTWNLGDIVTVEGGQIPSLDDTLKPLVPADCSGPYWLVGGLSASASPTPTPAVPATAAPGALTAAPTLTPYLNIIRVTETVLTRAGPSAVYGVVGQLDAGQTYPVVGQSGQWWQLAPANGHTAWVDKNLVTFTGDAQTVPIVAPPPTPTP